LPEIQDSLRFHPELELGLSAADEFDVEKYIVSEVDAEGETDDEYFPESSIKREKTDAGHETDDVSFTSPQWEQLISSANLKQDLVRCPPPPSMESCDMLSRTTFLFEEYARAARLGELHRHWQLESRNKQDTADIVRELDLISKRLIPCRLWKFEGRETLKSWQPLIKCVEKYSAEMSKIRGKTNDRTEHLEKTKALLADLLNSAAEIQRLCKEMLEDNMRHSLIAFDEAVLKEQLQRVRDDVSNDCSQRGCLPMTTLVTEEDVDFFKLSKRWKNANYLAYI
jgi:hypothetical protein